MTTVLAGLLVLLGFALLLYRWPAVPVGLHQDELSEAYESYCLLHTGADRWGYHLPVYFFSWGSGQNVLQAYLTVPVVAILGLTRVSARLVPLLCGMATLPLFFLTLRRWCSEKTALLGLLFLAVSPWHIMLSRWGIENSPLPFFTVLGLYTFGRACGSDSRWRIWIAFIPFALALYTYGVVFVVMPVLLPLLCFLDPESMRRRARAWCGAFAVFVAMALPLCFFVMKNYLTKKTYAFERWLPFSVPLLPITRLDQVNPERDGSTIFSHNLSFVHGWLSDNVSWFMVFGQPPIQKIVLLCALAGIIFQTIRLWRDRRFNEPFSPLLIACVPILLAMPLNISRADPLFLPLIALGAIGLTQMMGFIQERQLRRGVFACLLLLFAWQTHTFRNYYGSPYADTIRSTFYPELSQTLDHVLAIAGPTMPVYITEGIAINYAQVLFLTRTPAEVFQQSKATYDRPEFGRYLFSRAAVQANHLPFTFLIKDGEPIPCATPTRAERSGQFLIGQCL